MCGIVGIAGTESVNTRIYDSLTVLQHRGQDAAGIATRRAAGSSFAKRMVWSRTSSEPVTCASSWDLWGSATCATRPRAPPDGHSHRVRTQHAERLLDHSE